MSLFLLASRPGVVSFLLTISFASSLVGFSSTAVAQSAAPAPIAPTQSDASKISEAAKTQEEAQKLYRQGEDSARSGDYRKAIENYNQSLQVNPNFSQGYVARGVARSKIGDSTGPSKILIGRSSSTHLTRSPMPNAAPLDLAWAIPQTR